ncbi:MAG: type II toxin-antitoxin system RelE/ParE family toxin [Vicinamibacterales bacterium]
MKVVWSATVVDELTSIHDYLAEQADPDSARSVVARLIRRGEQIAAYPESGRAVRDFGSPSIREVVEGPYRLVYEVNRPADRIEIVAVFHGARLPPWLREG